MLWLEHGDRFEPSARWNMAASSGHEPASGSLARFLASRQWVIDVDEYETQPEGYEDLKLPQWLRTISGAWLIVPLVLRDRLLGFVVLAHSRGRMRINWEVRDLLKSAGRQAASFLAQIEAAKALVIARQFESFNRMSAFVVHDLKNLIAQLSLLIANAERHGHKREFQEDMLQTVSNSVEKMKRLLFQLRGYSIEPPTQVDLRDLLAQVVAARSEAIPRPVLAAATESAAVVAHRSRLERVIGHLVQNAIEATPPTGRVDVSLQARSDQAIITIADNGSGMTDEFRRTRLFHPFESTKTSGMGIGTYETDQYVRELGGRIEVDSVEGHGSTFRIWLPVTREANGKEPSPMNQAVQSTGELG
jgi:putative PEP-CTERM system histidine kinase